MAEQKQNKTKQNKKTKTKQKQKQQQQQQKTHFIATMSLKSVEVQPCTPLETSSVFCLISMIEQLIFVLKTLYVNCNKYVLKRPDQY